jgi:hypothetical protein
LYREFKAISDIFCLCFRCEARNKVIAIAPPRADSSKSAMVEWSGVRFMNRRKQMQGPLWPLTFQAEFQEVLYDGEGAVHSNNPGAWYYDFAHRRARFDHLKGQKNNFCAGQGLSDSSPDEPCHLIFSPDTAMYVHYPTQRTCCQLCTAGIGCSPLLPDWIQDGRLVGREDIGGHSCTQYFKRGAVADDYWYETEAGMPCRYHEVLQFGSSTTYHNLTFDQSTYSTSAIDDSIFEVPSYCGKMCPHPFPSRDNRQTAKQSIVRS